MTLGPARGSGFTGAMGGSARGGRTASAMSALMMGCVSGMLGSMKGASK